jgi:hypothetical protein
VVNYMPNLADQINDEKLNLLGGVDWKLKLWFTGCTLKHSHSLVLYFYIQLNNFYEISFNWKFVQFVWRYFVTCMNNCVSHNNITQSVITKDVIRGIQLES